MNRDVTGRIALDLALENDYDISNVRHELTRDGIIRIASHYNTPVPDANLPIEAQAIFIHHFLTKMGHDSKQYTRNYYNTSPPDGDTSLYSNGMYIPTVDLDEVKMVMKDEPDSGDYLYTAWNGLMDAAQRSGRQDIIDYCLEAQPLEWYHLRHVPGYELLLIKLDTDDNRVACMAYMACDGIDKILELDDRTSGINRACRWLESKYVKMIPHEIVRGVELILDALAKLVEDVRYEDIDAFKMKYRFANNTGQLREVKVTDYRILNGLYPHCMSRDTYSYSLAKHFGMSIRDILYDVNGIIDVKKTFASLSLRDAIMKSPNLMQFLNVTVDDLVTRMYLTLLANPTVVVQCIAKVVGDSRAVMDAAKAIMPSLQPGKYYYDEDAEYLMENGVRMVRIVSDRDVYVIY